MARYLCNRCGDEGWNTTPRGEVLCRDCFEEARLYDGPVKTVEVTVKDERKDARGIWISINVGKYSQCDVHVMRFLFAHNGHPVISLGINCVVTPDIYAMIPKMMAYGQMCAQDKYFDNHDLELPAQPSWVY